MNGIYQLSKAQIMLRDAVRQLAQEKIKPIAKELEEKEAFPYQVHEWFKRMELYGLAIEEKWAGSGAGCVECALAVEQIAEISASCAILLGTYYLGPRVLMDFGENEIKEKYLKDIATGRLIPCFTSIEPEAGFDAANIQTRAVRDRNGWVITGTKCFAILADMADVFIVFAKTEPEKGTGGISSFLIEKGAKGLSIPKHENMMGSRAVHMCEIRLDGVRVPLSHMIGAEGDGYQQSLRTIEASCFVTAARSIGLAQGALDNAIQYAKGRIVFGMPVANLEAIQFMLADMAIRIEAARQLTYKTVSEIDMGDHNEALKLGSMAKCFAADTAVKVSTEALQIFGGYGFMEDYPMAQYYRDAKLLQLADGTTHIQKSIIAQRLVN